MPRESFDEELDWSNYAVGRLTRIDFANEDKRTRGHFEFDCLAKNPFPVTPESIYRFDKFTTPPPGIEAVRISTTMKKFSAVFGDIDVQVGDWFLLYFATTKLLKDGLPSWRSPLESEGFITAYKSWVFYGEKIMDDRGDEPPRHPVGAATTEQIDWANSIFQASNFPTGAVADEKRLKGVLAQVDRPDKLRVRDVGQASFSCLMTNTGTIVAYYDVGWPLAFNGRTIPKNDPVNFTRAPVILSHWDWDHLHYALRHRGRHLRECNWIVPIQKLGPGASWFANSLHLSNRLHGWNTGTLSFRFGQIGRCLGKSHATNDSGLVMLAHLSTQRSVLLIGDADYSYLPMGFNNPVDGLVATHHGARILSTWTAIPRPSPNRIKCIVSYGKNNLYNHPHEETIKKHKNAGWKQIVATAGSHGVARGDREFT